MVIGPTEKSVMASAEVQVSFHHKEIYEAHNAMKAVTAVAGGGITDSHVVHG